MIWPLGVFLAASVVGLVYLYLLDQVRVSLSQKHPDVFRELLNAAQQKHFQPMASLVARFIWRKGDKSLGDTRLSRLAGLCRLSLGASILLWFAIMATIFIDH